MVVPRGRACTRDRIRLDVRLAVALTARPAMATKAATVRTGMGAAGALRPQLAPEQPDGNVGGPSTKRAVMLAGGWLPARSACGMKPPSTVAARTTTRHQRHGRDMAPM